MSGDASSDLVQVSEQHGLLRIELAAPSGIHALTRPVRLALLAALTGPAAEPAVRAVLLRGRGRSFCVGQALDEHARRLHDDPDRAFASLDEEYAPLVRALRRLPKPVVAGIDGACAGAGISLALACDIRVASARTRFTFAFTSIGLTADTGLTALLVRSVGAARATALLMLDQPLSAAAAEAAGLVDVVVADDAFEAEATALALRLATGPTAAYAAVKDVVHRAETGPLEDILDAERDAQVRLGRTEDHRGAVEAFLAKRPPVFAGR